VERKRKWQEQAGPVVVAALSCWLIASFTERWAPFVEPYVGDLDIMWGEYGEDGDVCGLGYASNVNWRRHDPVAKIRFADRGVSLTLSPDELNACYGHTCYVEELYCWSHGGRSMSFSQDTAAAQPKLDLSWSRPSIRFDGTASMLSAPPAGR
jgi:hypothetical protein